MTLRARKARLALIDDGVIIHDSTIIGEYLEDRYWANPLLPRDPV